MIHLTNVSVQYQTTTLNLPNIAIDQGDIIGLSGKSGSGKSTIAMLFAGFLLPKTGHVCTPCYDKHTANPVQWVGQHPELSFNPKWTILRSLKESYRDIEFESRLIDFDIQKEWLTCYPKQLSGGQLQRLALFRALLPTTRYLLCDEITAQLDPLAQISIWKSVLNFSTHQNIGLLVISHEPSLLKSICKKIITLN